MKKHELKKKVLLLTFFLTTIIAYSQTPQQRKAITKEYNQSKLYQLRQEFQEKTTLRKTEALQAAQQKGWEVFLKNEDGSVDELMAVSSDGHPIYYTISNVNAARSTRANHLNIGGSLGLSLDGQGMTAHVWDGGPTLTTHQEFDGAGGSNRVSVNDGVTAINSNSFHSQHVTGTIVASGVVASAKGMAPQAKALTHEWNNDLSEATAEAADGMLVSNHSYGYNASALPDWYFGAYIEESRDWDDLMYNSPFYLMVVAAGNDGNDNSSNGSPLGGNSSFDKLSSHATSKNNMVVANGQDASVNSDGSLNSVTINSSSSEGPTDDLRVKPDITGNGSGLYSTLETSNTAYGSLTGTSMASPNVAGTLLLLQQHYNNVNGGFMRAATLKGLALHTADDAGISGPDAIYGWGLLNAKAAAEAVSNNGVSSRVEELSLSQGQSYSITVDADGVSPLIASISWTDPAGTANTGTANLSTPVLVNDLDIRVTKGSTTYQPYRLTGVNSNNTGDNIVDPFERINVSSASGSYTITVTHKGTLSGGSQNYTLVVTGITGTPPVCEATTPAGLNATGVGATTATLNWSSVTGATYDVRYRVTGTSTWTATAVSGTSTSLSGLATTTEYEAQVRSKCSDGSTSGYSSSVTFTTTDVVITYCSSNGNNTSDEYISRVQIGSINNASSASSGGYGDFTSLSTDLGKGSSASITITPTWTGTVYNEGYSVWIDYNQDGDFGDSGEQVFTQSATNSTSVNGSFTVPSSALDGSTRMRVSMKYNAVPTSCESFTYGEVEDYTVNITEGDDDDDDIEVTVSLTLVFDNYPEETSWEILSGSTVVASGGTYGSQADGSTLVETATLAAGCYDLVVSDAYGDGMCCSYGSGSYSLSDGSTTLASGGSFGSSETTNFCVGTSAASYAISSASTGTPAVFDIYPVPVKDNYLNVAATRDDVAFSIINVAGQTMISGIVRENKINVGHLVSGTYVIQLTTGKKTLTRKFIKE